MSNNTESESFGAAQAPKYDDKFKRLAPLTEGLHFTMQMVMQSLPQNARVLCVGAGTGAEVLTLARAYPQWHFTAVDPSRPMLEICKRRVEAEGLGARCQFHVGYLDTLPAGEPFAAATSILVAHFIMDADERQNFYAAMAGRVIPGGLVITAEMSAVAKEREDLLDVWWQALTYAELPGEERARMKASFGERVSILEPERIKSLLRDAGLVDVTAFYQALMIRAHFGRVPAT